MRGEAAANREEPIRQNPAVAEAATDQRKGAVGEVAAGNVVDDGTAAGNGSNCSQKLSDFVRGQMMQDMIADDKVERLVIGCQVLNGLLAEGETGSSDGESACVEIDADGFKVDLILPGPVSQGDQKMTGAAADIKQAIALAR